MTRLLKEAVQFDLKLYADYKLEKWDDNYWVNPISDPNKVQLLFPIGENSTKDYERLYLNDVGNNFIAKFARKRGEENFWLADVYQQLKPEDLK